MARRTRVKTSTPAPTPAHTTPPAAAPSPAAVTPPPEAPPVEGGIPDHVSEPRPSWRRSGQPMLFEIGFEVCNQLGGIYQVLRSKAPAMVSRWGDRYCMIGPYVARHAEVEFEQTTPPEGPIAQAVHALRQSGLGVMFGRWLVSGRPQVILLDYLSVFGDLAKVKYALWADHGISLPGHDELMNNCVAFGEAVRRLLWSISDKDNGSRKMVAHFHEWMAGTSIPGLRRDRWPGGIVFTTHATILGRYLASNEEHFYHTLPHYNPFEQAKKYLVESQFQLERAAAHGAHVFTTVSDVTGDECRHLLHRHPDIVLPNGLNIQRFAATHEFQNLHQIYKQHLHEFTMGHFFPSYRFDLDQTLYFFTSGRFEPRNKGMDLTIEALARLNYRLKQQRSNLTVVAFIVTRQPTKSINVGNLHNAAMLNELRTITNAIKDQLGDKLFYAVASGREPDANALIDDYWRLRLRRTLAAWKRAGLPSVVTHDLVDDQTDAVLNQIRNCRLFNDVSDPVKVIYHPDFITSTNPLFGIDYEQFVRGCHLGVFPSYYEPWGYTPLESIASGVPAVTSDLAGFGSYLRQVLPDCHQHGLWVVERRYRSYHEAADQLAEVMFQFCRLTRRERVDLRNRVEAFSDHFDWHNLGARYHEAHEMAMEAGG